jgi:hypothetical protein
MDSYQQKAGPIVLMGSGETAPSSGVVFEEVAKLYPAPLRIAILETPAGFELNSNRVAGRVGEFLQTRLQNYRPIIDIIPARKKGTDFSPDSENILEPLYKADMIFMGPGSPTYTARQLTGSLAYEIIKARQRTGAALVLASAATIAFGCQTMPVYEIYKAGMDLHWQVGLDFFKQYGLSLVIIPHWNNSEGGAELDTSRCFMGIDRFGTLCSLLTCNGTILGIDEHTSIWIDLNTNTAKAYGKGTVHIIQNDTENNFSTGEQIPVKYLGDFKEISDWRTGIREEIWQHLSSIMDTAHALDEVTPPEPIIEWKALRDDARRSGNFPLADELRKKIEQNGWQIKDTATGSELIKM